MSEQSVESEYGEVQCCGAHPIDAEAVPVEKLKDLAEQWGREADLFLDDVENISESEKGAARQQVSIAEQIEELAERYTRTVGESDV